MTLRPASARWFELLTERDARGAVLGVLAATASVELEAHSSPERPAALPDYAATLAEYAELARRYRTVWPAARVDAALPPPEAVAGAEDSLAELRAWAVAAEPTLQVLQRTLTTRHGLAELSQLLSAAEPSAPLLQLANCGLQFP